MVLVPVSTAAPLTLKLDCKVPAVIEPDSEMLPADRSTTWPAANRAPEMLSPAKVPALTVMPRLPVLVTGALTEMPVAWVDAAEVSVMPLPAVSGADTRSTPVGSDVAACSTRLPPTVIEAFTVMVRPASSSRLAPGMLIALLTVMSVPACAITLPVRVPRLTGSTVWLPLPPIVPLPPVAKIRLSGSSRIVPIRPSGALTFTGPVSW